jgi:hypothetical protein
VTGSGAASGTTSFLVENSNGHDILKATDDGDFTISTAAKLSVNFSGLYNAIYYKNSSGTQIGAFGIHTSNTGLFDVRSSGNNRVRISANSGIVVDLASGGDWDSKACLTLNSTTQGMLPPRMTNTQRDAISSPTTGLTLYSTTDNKLQFYNGSAWADAAGGDNIYTADGTLSGNRVVNFNSNTLQLGTQGTDTTGVKIFQDGRVQLPKHSGAILTTSYGSQFRQNFLTLYTNTTFGATVTGFTTIAASSNWSAGGTSGDGFSINARLGVIGKSATSTTDYAFRVQDSASADMLTVRDDGAITLGKSSIIRSTSNPQYSVVIGYQASDISSASNGAESVSIGRLAAGNSSSVAIGGQAKGLGASSVAVGAQAQAKATGVSVGFQAGGANAGSSAVSIGKFSQAQATGSITIGTNTTSTGANSVVLNATASGVVSSSSTDTFKVYMASSSTPDFQIAHNGNSYITGAGNFGVDITTPTDRIQTKTSIGVIGDGVNAGKLKLYCEAGSTNHVAIEGPAHSGGATYTIKLPNTAPSANQVLQSDSSGNLSWVNPRDLIFSGLPTSDPGVSGRLWNNEGVINVSE